MTYAAHLLAWFGIFALAATSLNIVTGYLGLLSLAQAGFFALGAYAWAVLSTVHGWSWPVATLAGMALAALASMPLALAAARCRGGMFVLASLAFQMLLFSLLRLGATDAPPGSLANPVNSVFGISDIPRPALAGIAIEGTLAYAVFALVVCAAGVLLCARLLHSPWGRALRALRDDTLVAGSLGLDATRLRLQAFALSAALAAVAGSLYAGYVSFVDPQVAGLDLSILLLAMVVLGGAGNLRGPLLGAALLLALPELLRLAGMADATGAQWRALLYGACLVLVIALRPQGIAGNWRLR
jgi:branched-chain amino acid transport system permease protein